MTKLTTLLPIEKIKTLSTPDLRSLHYKFQKYFYTAGYNIGFHTVILQKKTKEFKKEIVGAIEKQILHIANVDKLHDITRHKEKAIDRNLLLLLGAVWLAFDKSISIGKIGILTYLLWAGEQGGQIALDKIVPDRVFKLKDPYIERQFLERTAFLISTVDKTTQKWIATTIEEGLNNGWDMEKIAVYLKGEANKVAKERAEIITETELMNALNMVEVKTFEKNGIEMHKWITSADERVCILGGRTKVKTIDGYKEIRNINVGDYVLTHKDRYKKVVKTFKRKYSGEVVRIILTSSKNRNPIKLTVTKEHKILVKRNGRSEWITAWNLKEEDLIYIEGKRCICNKVIPFYYPMCLSCKTKETNKIRWLKKEEKDNLIKFNKKYNKASLMNRAFIKKITILEFNLNFRKKISDTKKQQWIDNPELRENQIIMGKVRYNNNVNHPFKLFTKKQRIEYLKKAWKNCGNIHSGKSYLEKKVKWFLEKEKINFITQWCYKYKDDNKWRTAYADFMLPNIKTIIECDGYYHQKLEIKYKDKLKDDYLNEKGFNILRFNEDKIRNTFHKVASEIKRLNCITTIGIRKLYKWKLKSRTKNNYYQVVYNLMVDEDQSYTANGIVVHNCESQCIPNETAGAIKVGDIFPSGMENPPAHISCRCFLLPILPEYISGPVWTGQ